MCSPWDRGKLFAAFLLFVVVEHFTLLVFHRQLEYVKFIGDDFIVSQPYTVVQQHTLNQVGVGSLSTTRKERDLETNSSKTEFSEIPGTGTKRHSCSTRIENNQTTISIPTVPSFIIVGAQRSGSSTLAELLWDHPDIVGPSDKYTERTFEPHYFDWDFPSAEERQTIQDKQNLTEEELFCQYRRDYARTFDIPLMEKHPNLLAFEKTPSYMFHGHLPSLILRMCPWKPQIVVILRNPVDRAFSHHNVQKQQKNNRTFEEVIEKEVDVMRELGLTSAPSLSQFTASTDFEETAFAIPNMTIDELAAAHKQLHRSVHLLNCLQRSTYWSQLWYWKEVFGTTSHLLVLQYERLYNVNPDIAQDEYYRLLNFLRVSPRQVAVKHHQQHAKYPAKMSLATRAYLERFFRPHNARLADTLEDKRWRGVWETDLH